MKAKGVKNSCKNKNAHKGEKITSDIHITFAVKAGISVMHFEKKRPANAV